MAKKKNKNTLAFERLTNDIVNLSQSVAPGKRAKLLKTIAAELIRRHRNRIKLNIEPDGSPMDGRSGERFKFRRLRDGEGLNGRNFHFFGRINDGAWSSPAYSRTENGNELVRFEGERELYGFKREYLLIRKTTTRARLQMFRNLGRAKWLKSKADSNEAVIGWFGGSAAHIAIDHDEGNTRKNLPSRLLLGLSTEDLLYIQEQILNAVNGGFTD